MGILGYAPWLSPLPPPPPFPCCIRVPSCFVNSLQAYPLSPPSGSLQSSPNSPCQLLLAHTLPTPPCQPLLACIPSPCPRRRPIPPMHSPYSLLLPHCMSVSLLPFAIHVTDHHKAASAKTLSLSHCCSHFSTLMRYSVRLLLRVLGRVSPEYAQPPCLGPPTTPPNNPLCDDCRAMTSCRVFVSSQLALCSKH